MKEELMAVLRHIALMFEVLEKEDKVYTDDVVALTMLIDKIEEVETQ